MYITQELTLLCCVFNDFRDSFILRTNARNVINFHIWVDLHKLKLIQFLFFITEHGLLLYYVWGTIPNHFNYELMQFRIQLISLLYLSYIFNHIDVRIASFLNNVRKNCRADDFSRINKFCVVKRLLLLLPHIWGFLQQKVNVIYFAIKLCPPLYLLWSIFFYILFKVISPTFFLVFHFRSFLPVATSLVTLHIYCFPSISHVQTISSFSHPSSA